MLKRLTDAILRRKTNSTSIPADEKRVVIRGRYIYTIIRKCRPVHRAESDQGWVALYEARRHDSYKCLNERCILTEICRPDGTVVERPTTSQIIYSVDSCLDTTSRRHLRGEGIPV